MCMSGYLCGNVKTKKAMKARTKKERSLLELRKGLRQGMTEAQRRWAADMLIREEFGAMQMTIVTTHKGWTVLRTFFCQDDEARGMICDEVYENWIDDEGKETILSKSYNRSPFYFNWKTDSEWGINRHNGHCSGYYVMDDVYKVGQNYIYPVLRVTKKLRRNGYDRSAMFVDIEPVVLMRLLLTNPTAEWLVKVFQYRMLEYLSRYGDLLVVNERHPLLIGAVKICVRNGYKIYDASMYADYIDLLRYFGKDTHNAFYVCPKDLRAEHDRLMQKKQRIEEKKELEQRIREAARHEKSYKEHRGLWFGICFGNEDIVVTVIQSVAEMAEEGTKMHHCVFANEYWNVQKHPDSLILSAKDRQGNRLETVEVNMKTWSIVQSRGLLNDPSERHDEIIELVKENMYKLKIA